MAFYKTKKWEDWLSALYESGDVSLVDFAVEMGWEHLILKEYRVWHYYYGLHLTTGTNQNDLRYHERHVDILYSCLEYIYPKCPNCTGGYLQRETFSGGYHTDKCMMCERGLLLPRETE